MQKSKPILAPKTDYVEVYEPLCSEPPKVVKPNNKSEKKVKSDDEDENEDGLDYTESEDGVEEDDFFYHLEVRK